MEALWKFVREEVCPVSDNCVPGFVAGAHWGWGDARIRVGQILKTLPAKAIPDAAVCFFKDGDDWCAVFGDFINLQESPAGFGATFEEALAELQAAQKASPA